jgi:hypothetical protein
VGGGRSGRCNCEEFFTVSNLRSDPHPGPPHKGEGEKVGFQLSPDTRAWARESRLSTISSIESLDSHFRGSDEVLGNKINWSPTALRLLTWSRLVTLRFEGSHMPAVFKDKNRMTSFDDLDHFSPTSPDLCDREIHPHRTFQVLLNSRVHGHQPRLGPPRERGGHRFSLHTLRHIRDR